MNLYNTNWGVNHADVFSELIGALNARNIHYFILRNYESLPEKNTSKDVDILIEPGSYKQAAGLLKEIYIRHGFSYITLLHFERVHCWYASNFQRQEAIHIDLIEGYLTKGIQIFPYQELYQNTHIYRDFRILNDDYDVVMLLIYKLIMSKRISYKYQSQINARYVPNGNMDKILLAVCGKSIGTLIINALTVRNYDELERNQSKIVKSIKLRSFFRAPFSSSKNIARFIFGKIYRIMWCPRHLRKFFAVLGPDGVGKSTFIDQLCKRLEFYYLCDDKIALYHHRPTLLPNLGEVAGKTKMVKVDTDFSKPHRSRAASPLSSLCRMLYYWLDYVIGMPVILRKNIKWDYIVTFDRYIYDFVIDPRRSRINLPDWLRMLFCRLVIQPPVVFILRTDADTIYKRKQELSLEEIQRQLEAYSNLAGNDPRFVFLDASETPEDMAEDAAKILVKEFATYK